MERIDDPGLINSFFLVPSERILLSDGF